MKTLALTILLVSANSMAAAPIDFDTSCRLKAKEVASDSYRTCITENKTSRIEKIREEYQDEVRALKEKFEKKISKLSGKAGKKSRKSVKTSEAPMALPPANEEPTSSAPDESTMDIPEPIPVDNSNF